MKKPLYAIYLILAIALIWTYLNKTNQASNANVTRLQTCDVKPKSVHDGDTIRVICQNEEVKVRFACIDAPELKMDGGEWSRDELRSQHIGLFKGNPQPPWEWRNLKRNRN